MLKVSGEGQFARVSGSNLGGGTFWGLCRLLTKCRGFDEMLELSMRGDNAKARRGRPGTLRVLFGISWSGPLRPGRRAADSRMACAKGAV
jgi:hypothetical protein